MTCFQSELRARAVFEGGERSCFALLGESLFQTHLPGREKVTKNALALAAARGSLHRCSGVGLQGPSMALAFAASMRLTPYTAIPLTLLKGRRVSPDGHRK